MKKNIKKDYVRLSGSSTEVKGNILKSNSTTTSTKSTIVDPKEIWSILEGTWVGSNGFNLIAVPSPGSKTLDKGAFDLLTAEYNEVLSFKNGGAPALNRGGDKNQYVSALEYHQQISNKETDEGLHIENGMFLDLVKIVNDKGELVPPKYNIARSGTIPHGDSIMLLGESPVLIAGTPVIPQNSPRPVLKPEETPNPLGYFDLYNMLPQGDINQYLKNILAQQQKDGYKIDETITFKFDSEVGGINNIPFINKRAKAAKMNITYWLEKVYHPNSKEYFYQLQYSQIVNLFFHLKKNAEKDKKGKYPLDAFINWPHISVNTLVKQ